MKKWLLITVVVLFSNLIFAQAPPVPNLSTPLNNATGQSVRPRIDWLGVMGATGYLYQVDTTSSFNSPLLINGMQSFLPSRADLSQLRFGTKYYWRVASRNATDTSAWSVTFAFTTTESITLQFPLNNASNLSTSVNISWNGSIWTSYYLYEVDETPLFNSANKISGNTLGLTGISGRRANLTGLKNGQDYYWRVAMVGPTDTSNWSPFRKFTTLFLLTTPPSQISPVNGDSNVVRQSAVLDWDTISGASNYHVQFSTTNSFTATTPFSTLLNSQYTLPQLNNFTTYYWRVRASNNSGNSPWSSVWSFTTEDCITTDTIRVNACTSYQLNGTVYNTSGLYNQTLINTRGCDSLIHLDLTVNLPSSSSLTRTACDSFTLNNQTYLLSGNYTQIIPNAVGCDSAISLNLTVLNSSVTPISVTSCNSYTWNNTGITYTNSGTYFDTLQSSLGCDSIVVLTLTILPVSSSLTVINACDSFSWRGNTFLQTGIYSDTIINTLGCDSILTLDLSINRTSITSTNQSACGSYLWQQNGQTYTASGTYFDTLISTTGCDSILALNLTIDTAVVNTVTRVGLSLTSDQMGASYQWLDCSNGNAPILGATSQSYIVTINGDYAVEVTRQSCVDTSACITVLSVGLDEITTESGLKIYPNPANQFIQVDFNKRAVNTPLEILSSNGKLVKAVELHANQQTIDVSDLTNGLYFIRYGKLSAKFLIARK